MGKYIIEIYIRVGLQFLFSLCLHLGPIATLNFHASWYLTHKDLLKFWLIFSYSLTSQQCTSAVLCWKWTLCPFSPWRMCHTSELSLLGCLVTSDLWWAPEKLGFYRLSAFSLLEWEQHSLVALCILRWGYFISINLFLGLNLPHLLMKSMRLMRLLGLTPKL